MTAAKHNRLVGFSYDPETGIARFSMYLPGTGGRERRRATVRATSYDDAIRLWSVFRTRATEGLRRPSPQAPTFAEFVRDYFPAIAVNIAPKTARDYGYVIQRHLLPALGSMNLADVTAGVLNALGARLKALGLAGATVNGYVNIAALLLGYAVEFDVLAESPIKKKLKRLKTNKPCNELTADERCRFLAAFDDEVGFRNFLAETMPQPKERLVGNATFGGRRAHGARLRTDSEAAHLYFLRFQRSKYFFIAALETGLRVGDLRNLRATNVSLAEGWIRLEQQKVRREVIVPLTNASRVAIRQALAGRIVQPDDFLYVTEIGERYSDSSLRRYFAIAKRLAGIRRRLRRHDLRHDYGSRLATAGVPLAFIGRVMGHQSVATTARYARPDASVLDRVRKALEEE